MDSLFLYIHIPFCNGKCPYCSFYSIDKNFREFEEIYFKALIEEINACSKIIDFTKRSLETIYFGGGTPSLISVKYIEKLLENIYSLFHCNHYMEITIETNPDSLDEKKLASYKKIGINRLSLGVQSCLDKNLKTLERKHSISKVKTLLSIIKELKFNSVNFDFIYHIPGQTMKDLEEEFSFIKKYEPTHISFYGLILEEGTIFYELYKNGYEETEEELYRQMYLEISRRLEEMGYVHYEISNFAKPGFSSRHNMAYWDFMDYLGIGASAASYIEEKRFKNIPSVRDYINNIKEKKLSINNPERRDRKDILLEKIFLGLRKRPGINLPLFCREYDLNLQEIRDKIKYYIPHELWFYKEPYFELTTEGFLLSNSIAVEIFDLIEE